MSLKCLVFAALLAFAAMPAAAQDQPEIDARVAEFAGREVPLPDRPFLAPGRLIWTDYALAYLCAEFGGTFSKMPGKALYQCRHENFVPVRFASDEG